MSKAKACEEMIQYERPVSTNNASQATLGMKRDSMSNIPGMPDDPKLPQPASLKECEAALVQYIKDTTLAEPKAGQQQDSILNSPKFNLQQEQETPASMSMKGKNEAEAQQ